MSIVGKNYLPKNHEFLRDFKDNAKKRNGLQVKVHALSIIGFTIVDSPWRMRQVLALTNYVMQAGARMKVIDLS
jgi:hypothetical protein